VEELYDRAAALLEAKFNRHMHPVAAALRTSDGLIITAVGINHFLNAACAETAALVIAINQGKYDVTEIVALTKDDDGQTVIANMCGKCRQTFHDYAPDTLVRTTGGDLKVSELLPYPFDRQRHKIDTAKDERRT